MNNKQLFLAALAFTTLVAGCKQSDQASNSSGTDSSSLSVTQQLESAREVATNAWQETKDATTNVVANVTEGTMAAWTDIKDSVQTTNDYPYDQKDAFVAGASADLNALDQKITELSDKAAATVDPVKTEAQAKLQVLHEERLKLDKKLDDVKSASEADWNAVKVGFTTSYDDTKSLLKQTWQWFTDKLNS